MNSNNIVQKSSRSRFSVFATAFCVFLIAVGFTAKASAKENSDIESPNVVVFLVDDMGLMDTSVAFLTDEYGVEKRYPLNDFYQTPNIQSLANQGIRFSNFYAMSVCSPTRASILTGQNSARHHTTQWISPEKSNAGQFGPINWNWSGLTSNSATLPAMLKSKGYRTIHIGKGHFGPFDSEGSNPANLGFSVSVAGNAIGAPGSYFGKDNFRRKRGKKNRAVPQLEKYHGADIHLSDALTEEAITHVREAVAEDVPFFLYLSHYAVHSPHQSDPRFATKYADAKKPERAKNFATLVEGVDKSLGDLISEIKNLEIGRKTLIIFLGDNGSDAPLGDEHEVACSAPLRGKKGSHYEGGVRVPFIAAWITPDQTAPLQSKFPVGKGIQPQMGNVSDLLPTICEVTGVEQPSNSIADGQSLSKLMSGKPDPEHSKQFLLHFPHEHRSSYFSTLRDGDWKVAYQYRKLDDSNGERYQLFNLKNDPFEQTNLATTNPKQLRLMMNKLASSLEQHGAQYPREEESNESSQQLPIIPN